jgi:hypothetical protein
MIVLLPRVAYVCHLKFLKDILLLKISLGDVRLSFLLFYLIHLCPLILSILTSWPIPNRFSLFFLVPSGHLSPADQSIPFSGHSCWPSQGIWLKPGLITDVLWDRDGCWKGKAVSFWDHWSEMLQTWQCLGPSPPFRSLDFPPYHLAQKATMQLESRHPEIMVKKRNRKIWRWQLTALSDSQESWQSATSLDFLTR